MNILNYDLKTKHFPDKTTRNKSKWSYHMEDLIRRTNKNLSTGVYVPPRYDSHLDMTSLRPPSRGLALEEVSF